jgi:hypothetical protein
MERESWFNMLSERMEDSEEDGQLRNETGGVYVLTLDGWGVKKSCPGCATYFSDVVHIDHLTWFASKSPQSRYNVPGTPVDPASFRASHVCESVGGGEPRKERPVPNHRPGIAPPRPRNS